MTPFESLARDMLEGVNTASKRIEQFGYLNLASTSYTADDLSTAVSGIHAGILIWMTSHEEERLGGSFMSSVVNQLPTVNHSTWPRIVGTPGSTQPVVRRIMESVWGVRIAYTHANGKVAQIQSRQNQAFAQSAPSVLTGCVDRNGWLDISGLDFHPIIRSFALLQSVLP